MSDHLYDRPGIVSPKQFLLAVMHNPDAPLTDRIDAADKLLRLTYPREYPASQEPVLLYKIPELMQ